MTMLMILLVVGFVSFSVMVVGIVALLAKAAEQGFLGIVVYFACWLLLCPIMATACIIYGLVIAADYFRTK